MDPETRLRENLRHEIAALEAFIREERETALNLLDWFRASRCDMPDDEYRAVVFIRNEEFRTKLGSLTLLYETRKRVYAELPRTTKETAIDITRFRFKVYSAVLMKGGYL